MQSFQRLRQTLLVVCEATKARHPREAALLLEQPRKAAAAGRLISDIG